MRKHLERDISKLKEKLLSLSSMVEDRVYKATKAVIDRDKSLAEAVTGGDEEIDDMEVEIEEECLKVLALNQPVAFDLRFIVAVLKINNDLERIGDLALNIASRARSLADLHKPKSNFDFEEMMIRVKEMLSKGIQSLIHFDANLAKEVCRSDRDVDATHRDAFQYLQEMMKKYPEDLEPLVHYLSVSRILERIADHSTNIAEDVLYMVEGAIVRHKKL